MPTLDPRVDAYIAAAAAFAQPILVRIRADVHAACPEVVETIKWRFPNFLLDGKILAGMAAFKGHCSLGFWKREGGAAPEGQEGMGDYGKLTQLSDLPSKTELRRRVKEAASLIRAGAPRASTLKPPREALPLPGDLARALAADPAAQQHFDAFSPSKQRDYIEWVLEAKRPETREKRVLQSVEWIAEGKSRNWKYESC